MPIIPPYRYPGDPRDRVGESCGYVANRAAALALRDEFSALHPGYTLEIYKDPDMLPELVIGCLVPMRGKVCRFGWADEAHYPATAAEPLAVVHYARRWYPDPARRLGLPLMDRWEDPSFESSEKAEIEALADGRWCSW